MDGQLNRFCRKIPTILQIDPNTIHQELWSSVLHHLQQLQDEKNVFIKEEKISSTCLRPLSQFTGENIQLIRQVISNDPRSKL